MFFQYFLTKYHKYLGIGEESVMSVNHNENSNYAYEGFNHLLNLFKDAQSRSPKGISLTKRQRGNKHYIYLQIWIGEKRIEKPCNCDFTQIGIVSALDKANKIKEALKYIPSESEFLEWYNKNILDISNIQNDLITFDECIHLIEDDFWAGRRKNNTSRVKGNPSDEKIWHENYGRCLDLLPKDKTINLQDMMKAINTKQPGSSAYALIVRVMKKVCDVAGNQTIKKHLDKLNTKQQIHRDLQAISLDEYIEFREKVLQPVYTKSGVIDKRFDLQTRKSWLWVFSMQVIYGLRISEVFAIKNLHTEYITKDKTLIPAFNRIESSRDMVIVIGDTTEIGTTTKTGYRLAIPLIPPTHPDLIEILDIRNVCLPTFNFDFSNSNPRYISDRYANHARMILKGWGKQIGNEKFTQTHALRHLANLNGLMAGISLEKRAMSLGHSPEMNDRVYKKRATTQTTLDILTKSDTQAIPLESAIKIAVQTIQNLSPKHQSKPEIIQLLSAIYNVSEDEIRSKLK